MRQRGRKSAAELELSVIKAETAFRPPAPSDLTPEQADEWRSVVNRMPADWFSAENTALLSQLCRHVVAARRCAQLIAAAEASDDFTIESYDRLLKMQERETRACATLAVKMRLAQSTRMRPETASTAISRDPGVRRPWEGY